MRTYSPDRWVMLKITSPQHGSVYKVLGSWYGGYLNGDSWKLSSGTTDAFPDDEHPRVTHFPQESGSTYICHKQGYGMSGYTSGVLRSWLQGLEGTDSTIEVLDENFDIALVKQK